MRLDNSELVFTNAVVLVEGTETSFLVDYLSERITCGAGGHYALGIAVIEVSGIETISHLVRLAQLFGLRAYVITDKDGVRKTGDKVKRKVLEILKVGKPRPSQDELARIRRLTDAEVS